MESALVTGASGFVGRHLCRHLTEIGVAVTGLDMRPESAGIDYRYIQADIVTGAGLEALAKTSFDVVFHLAAAGVKAVSREWPSCIDVNILGTLNVMQKTCFNSPRPVFVFTHTYYEDYIFSIPAMTENAYVMSKFAMTQVLRTFAKDFKGSLVTAKLFQIYGTGDAPGNVLPYALTSLMQDQPVLLSRGLGMRDWLHIDDLIAGLVACWHSSKVCGLEEFDLGSGHCHSIKEVVMTLAGLMKKPDTLLQFDASRDRGDVVANGKAENPPKGWRPHLSLTQGLERLIAGSECGMVAENVEKAT